MDDSQDSKETKNSLRRFLEEKYSELKDQGYDPDPECKLAEASTSLYGIVGKAISIQMAYEIIGSVRWSFDGEGYDMPGTTVFDVNRHLDNRPLWDFINENKSHVHFVNEAKDRFYFDDNELAVMFKLML